MADRTDRLSQIAAAFGYVPEASDDQRMGAKGSTNPLTASTVPLGGRSETQASTPRDTSPASSTAANRIEVLTLLKDAGAKIAQQNIPVSTEPAISAAPSAITVVGATPASSTIVAQQNATIAETFISKRTQTKGGKKTVTEIYSITPNTPIEQQTVISQQTQTKGRTKTVRQVYSA